MIQNINSKIRFKSTQHYEDKKISQNKFRISQTYASSKKHKNNNNPEVDILRLPQHNKKYSTIVVKSQRNTLFKVDSLSQKIEQLSINIKNTRLQANETMKKIRLVGKLLVQEYLQKYKSEIKISIDDLHKVIKITQKDVEDRFKQLRQNYQNLWYQTQSIKQNIFELSINIEKIENTLGYGDFL